LCWRGMSLPQHWRRQGDATELVAWKALTTGFILAMTTGDFALPIRNLPLFGGNQVHNKGTSLDGWNIQW
jgi:hypothetical protein